VLDRASQLSGPRGEDEPRVIQHSYLPRAANVTELTQAFSLQTRGGS